MVASRVLSASTEVALPCVRAFEVVIADVGDALARQGATLIPGHGGRVVQDGQVVGTVTAWEPGTRVTFEWRPAPWKADETVALEIRVEAIPDGCRVAFEVRGWGGLLADDPSELAAWFGSAVLAPIVQAVSPRGVGDWLTDRRVRRPTGPWAREVYGNPTYHIPNFLLILDRIRLGPDDQLLEVGCGGGAFLRRALESGCRATGVDHSPEMVRLASAQNREAIDQGRLTILESEAYPLPVADNSFTCSVMTGVIGFLPDPVAALREVRRALRPGGRVAVFGATAVMRGTPAAPEPFASRIRFFDPGEFAELGHAAGLVDVRVEEPDLEEYARAAQIPEEALPMFRKKGGSLLLLARKG